MKKYKFKTLGFLMLVTFACRCVQAQGTVYLSNLGVPSTGGYSVASDSWLAIGFRTGSNTGGYLLNSVQLALLDATGDPSSFAVDLRIIGGAFAVVPGPSLSPLTGTTDPQSVGLYSFDAPPSLALLPNAYYFIVLSAGTALANGAYQWSTTATSPNNPGNDWQSNTLLVSSDGLPDFSIWNPIQPFTYTQFALNATAIPEPSSLALILLSGGTLMVIGRRRMSL